jgi:MFS family permease
LTDSENAFQQEVERNYPYNFLVNMLDGAFFWCGASLIAVRTILPVYASYLTDSRIVIGVLSTIGTTGWLLPQLFTANWVQRLPRKKVLPVNVGLFTERLPVALMAPSALLADRFPTLALVIFLVLITWHTVGAGVVAVAWQDMIAKIIPSDRRGRFFGITNSLGTGTGVVGATVAAWLLGRFAFPYGYAWCFALAAALILTSWGFMAMAREPIKQPSSPPVSQREYWQGLPAVLQRDPNFVRYLLSQVVIAFGSMAVGFLAVYAVQRWSLPDGQVGLYTASMLVGQALSNLLYGPLADRRGHKLVLELGTLAAVAGIGLAAVVVNPGWFYLVFGLIGASTASLLLSGLMIALEFGPADLRPTYIGLNNTVRGAAAGAAPLVGGWLADATGYPVLFGISCGLGLAGLALLRWAVVEPRLDRTRQLAGRAVERTGQ